MPMYERNTWFFAAMARELGERSLFGRRSGEVERPGQSDVGGYDLVGQCLDAVEAQGREHGTDVVVARTDVPIRETIGGWKALRHSQPMCSEYAAESIRSSSSRGIGHPNPDHPSLAVGIGVQQFGMDLQQGVGFDDLTGQRGEELRHRLDRLDRPARGMRGDRRSFPGQLDEHHVAELALRIVGDPDRGEAGLLVEGDPFVVLAVAQLIGDVRHPSSIGNFVGRGAGSRPGGRLPRRIRAVNAPPFDGGKGSRARGPRGECQPDLGLSRAPRRPRNAPDGRAQRAVEFAVEAEGVSPLHPVIAKDRRQPGFQVLWRRTSALRRPEPRFVQEPPRAPGLGFLGELVGGPVRHDVTARGERPHVRPAGLVFDEHHPIAVGDHDVEGVVSLRERLEARDRVGRARPPQEFPAQKPAGAQSRVVRPGAPVRQPDPQPAAARPHPRPTRTLVERRQHRRIAVQPARRRGGPVVGLVAVRGDDERGIRQTRWKAISVHMRVPLADVRAAARTTGSRPAAVFVPGVARSHAVERRQDEEADHEVEEDEDQRDGRERLGEQRVQEESRVEQVQEPQRHEREAPERGWLRASADRLADDGRVLADRDERVVDAAVERHAAPGAGRRQTGLQPSALVAEGQRVSSSGVHGGTPAI